ncbi:hypothetical protein NCS57_00966400 [Fusarium keratoplasticum]|uniref:Uncharacterized protein n=1 Tax=Fusarium keratoplasticum TaxID=1328300 RepID=A0ACC0QS74_9HYPO|nr:hypothetical protein NCS57_00966400 [Fusarium keratoplasticum]KAI8663649.1 hypothetical protein NCS57_00966400 [Fusarium keratoplasticum]KAI8664292.1 hypothetical protein NCS55_00937400 [Fusarium keratoplasticum]
MFTKTACSLLVLASAAQGFKFTGPEGDSLDVTKNITITWKQENKTTDNYEIGYKINISAGEYIWSPSENTRKELAKYKDALTKNKIFRFQAELHDGDEKTQDDVFSSNYTLTGVEEAEANAGSEVMPTWGLVAGGLAAAGLMMA